MKSNLRTLIIDDNPDDRTLVIRQLRREFPEISVMEISDGVEFERAMNQDEIDLVITDYQIKWSDGIRVLQEIKAVHPACPVIMFTGTGSEEIAVEAMKHGLDDYVVKSPSDYVRLRNIVRATLEKKESEMAIAALEDKLQALLNRLNVGVFRATSRGNVLEANGAFYNILGLQPDEQRNPVNLLDFAVDQKERRHLTKKLDAAGAIHDYELAMRRSDGQTIWAAITETLFGSKGEHAVIEGLLEDITRRKTAEELLRRNEERLRRQNQALRDLTSHESLSGGDLLAFMQAVNRHAAATLEVERVGVWIFGPENRILRCIDMYSLSKNQHTSGTELHTDTYPGYFEALRSERAIDAHDARADARTCEFTESYLVPNGITSMLDAAIRVAGEVVGVICHEHTGEMRHWTADEQNFAASIADLLALALEAANRRQVEDRLRTSEERFRQLVENASDIITILAPDNTIEYVSPSIEKVLNLDVSEISGRDFVSLALEEEQPALRTYFLNDVQDNESVPFVEIRFKCQDGTPRLLEIIGRPISTKEGQHRLMVICRDITERKRLEEQLLHAQKMEAIGRLAGGIAHDFNNLLTVITGYSDLMLEVLDKDSWMREDLEEIRKATDRATSLTRQLLAFSRKQVMQTKVFNLNLIVSDMSKLLRRVIGEDIALQTRLNAGPCMIKADRTQIEQVVVNLAVNARDAMPRGGELRVMTERVTLNEPFTGSGMKTPAGDYVKLTVADTGTGMEDEVRDRIFEPFFTTKPQNKGTGLGLATVYGIVQQSGGYIHVESELGHGTSFSIYFPYVENSDVPDGEETTAAESLKGDETLLLVEDDEMVRTLTKRILEDHGYEVVVAKDGQEALEIAGHQVENIDLLVTDVVLPHMSGRELAERLCQRRPDLKVIFMSGYTDDDTMQDQVRQSFVNFMQKPFRAEDLMQKVREVLDVQ